MPNYARAAFVFMALTLLLTLCLSPYSAGALPDSVLDHPIVRAAAVLPPVLAVPALQIATATPSAVPLTPTADTWIDPVFTVPPQLRLLTLQAGTVAITITADAIDLHLPAAALVAQVLAAGDEQSILHQLVYDQSRLRAVLEQLAQQVDRPAQMQATNVGEDGARHFVVVPGVQLDLDAAQARIDAWLRAPTGPGPITLALVPAITPIAHTTPAQLQREIEALVQDWDGVAGVYVEDLTRHQVLAGLNQNTVFSGASTLKATILLQAYLTLPTFTEDQQQWLQEMIVDSSNIAANELLAATAGGTSSNDAARGAQALSAMLRNLGLQHTYLSGPYEDDNYPVDFSGVVVTPGPDQEGTPPYTAADPFVRTTPAEMSRVFGWIDACSHGTGLLLQRFPQQLTADRCAEMIARLKRNGDHTRMLAGLPDGLPVAHKSGWIDDTQGDVGIVYTPSGPFLLAVYLYQGENSATAGAQAPLIARIARLVYSYYMPET